MNLPTDEPCEFCEIDGMGNHAPRCPITLEAEIERLNAEINRRKGDPATRLHNICEGLERDKNDSPYSAESWDELTAENDEQRKRITQLERELAAAQARARNADHSACFIYSDRLKALLAEERGCRECWKGETCGNDCRMNDVVASAMQPSVQGGDSVSEHAKQE